jgi:hypothetical protein
MKILKTIYAEEGKILTNGEIYGRWIALAEDASETDFHEITEEEYKAVMDREELANGNAF